jgi:hypothetical protein
MWEDMGYLSFSLAKRDYLKQDMGMRYFSRPHYVTVDQPVNWEKGLANRSACQQGTCRYANSTLVSYELTTQADK